jgi:bifunctional DNA-binding transcriptional regulator/antitoxin component of YhaV-PrlF toxin-antitoxin module
MALQNNNSGIVFTVYMRCEGRVTVPKELRDAYNLKEGDLIECRIKKIK